MLTMSLAVVVGAAGALLTYPHVKDYLLIRALGAQGSGRRGRAIARAAAAAKRSPRFLKKLQAALNSQDDRQFEAVVIALRQAGLFDRPGRDPLHVDRMLAIELAGTRSAEDPQAAAATRRMILVRVLLSGRDNRYVRKALEAAATDDAPEVRRDAALLAARIGDDATLRRLLGDDDPAVAAGAALDAGLAGRTALIDDISRRMDAGDDTEIVSSAAYALALLDPAGRSAKICRMLRSAKDGSLRDRLLHVMTVLGDAGAKAAVGEVLAAARRPGEIPPAAIVAGAKLRVHEARACIKSVAADAAREGADVTRLQALAAFDAAWRWPIDVGAEAEALCRRRWGPHLPLTLIAAVRALAGGGARPGRIQALRMAAVWQGSATRPDGPSVKWTVTAIPSAAAAVALWKLKAPLAGQYVRNSAACEQTLAGDYVAWHLGRLDGPDAFDLGLAMLPPPRVPRAGSEPQPQRVYNENERSAGAMLLALSARTPRQAERARKRIESRLGGGALGGEDNFFVRGAYRCALLILGRADLRATVRQLLETAEFPQRRAATALLVSGDPYALDWMLWGRQRTNDYVAFLLINKGLCEVLAACAAQLPGVDLAASPDLLDWQVRILRDSYALKRRGIRLGLRPLTEAGAR